jgi:predicted nucleic acid-binding protein
VEGRLKVFLDTSVLFTAVYSETGGSRLILKLGEAGVVQLWVGPWVLREAEEVIKRKSPRSKTFFALLLARSQVRVGQEAGEEATARAMAVVGYLPDAQVVAEALEGGVDYFVSFDREHILENPNVEKLPFPVGAAGDFLAWYRARLADGAGIDPCPTTS